MHPSYSNVSPYHALAQPHQSFPVDETKKRYAESDSRVRNAISRSPLRSHEIRECLDFVGHLRIHKHLFMHTYIHLASCCRGRYLRSLMESANAWNGWDSIRQLTHHALIRNQLLRFWGGGSPCHQHQHLSAQHFVISDDESDLLCHLLYCGKKQELYELASKPAASDLNECEQVIELLWQFLMRHQETNVLRRLRACMYRMSRKSAYLPHALNIPHPSISNRQALTSGAHGSVTKAAMQGHQVVIKRIRCGDRATQRKCLELFAGEAILWHTLQHKNIVPFLGVLMEGTFDMGLVSPFFRNGNVRNYLRGYRSKDWPALARSLAKGLAKGLAYIHSHEPPIVHGDLKGDNVLVDDDGHARLGDFGQSYASDSANYLDSTRVGLATHSPIHWMAPELMMEGDRAKVSDNSDIFSYGCVLYEMVSGKIPFEGLQFAEVVNYVTKGDRPAWPQSIRASDPLWKIAKSCWEHHPKARPSASRLVSLLG